MRLNKDPKTQEVVTLNLSERRCNPHITVGEVVVALQKAEKPELIEEFLEKVKEHALSGKNLGDFLELCSDYVNLQIE
jgi:hypothetical protein